MPLKLQWQQVMDAAKDGRFFRVTFTKRTTGERRVMVCRTGVKRHFKGGEAPYSFEEKGLLPVFDVQKGGYRSIPVDAIEDMTLEVERA